MTGLVLTPGEPLDESVIRAGVGAIDWRAWQPTVRATLNIVVERGRLLLIRKKRGIGAGRITGPGGKLEPGEAPIDCAIREVREELGVTTCGTRLAGEFSAQFTDGLAMFVSVFTADGFDGELRETAEAAPHWVDAHAIPWDRMWPDNALWLPSLVEGRRFRAHFICDHDTLFDSQLSFPNER